jgi:phage terminase large subunit-like protein
MEHRLGYKPTEYERKFLLDDNQFQAPRWCRQSGKSFTASVKILWNALKSEGFQWGVLGPSFRQSKLIIRKITGLLLKLPKEILIGKKPLRTKVAFINGSVIEAYPNNPDTIRGPTLNGIYADEFNFFKDDEEIYDAILFTLGTTNGCLIATSTPWSRDHIFYKMCKDKEYEDFSRQHVTWQEAQEPNGPLKTSILQKIRKQLAADPWRWQREMEAEWAEDENTWFPQSLITSCIDPDMEIRIVDRQKSFWTTELVN